MAVTQKAGKMIDTNNYTSHTLENFDITLLQKEVDGGVITVDRIDEIAKYPEARSIIISGLDQDTFEYQSLYLINQKD